MQIINPSHKYTINQKGEGLKQGPSEPISIFLAGTIDNGESANWQNELIDELVGKYNADNIIIHNPRREHWNQNPSEKEMESQIKWEQEKLDESDYIFMNLEDNSKSPISLLELGLYATSNKLIVFCNDSFYRFMNVKLTCQKYNILLFEVKTVEEKAEIIMNVLTTYNVIKKELNEI